MLLAALLLLGACSQNETAALKVGTYKLTNTMHNAHTTLAFSEDGRITGRVVNTIMGQYETKSDTITITPTGTTMMMGPQEEMEAEQNFIKALLLVKKYRMQGNHFVLILDNGGELVFEPFVEAKEL